MIKQNSIIRICNVVCAILMATLLVLQFIPFWYSVNGVYVTDEQLETLQVEPTESQSTDPYGIYDLPIISVVEKEKPRKEYYCPTTENYTRVRKGPGVGYETIALLAPGSKVEVLGDPKNRFLETNYGWISQDYMINADKMENPPMATEAPATEATVAVTEPIVDATAATGATETVPATGVTEATAATETVPVTSATEATEEATEPTGRTSGVKKPPNRRPTEATEPIVTEPVIEKVSLAGSVWFNTHLDGGAPLPMFHVVVLFMGALGVFFCLVKNKKPITFFWALPVAILSVIGYSNPGLHLGMNWYIHSVIAALLLIPSVILMLFWCYRVYQWFTVKE